MAKGTLCTFVSNEVGTVGYGTFPPRLLFLLDMFKKGDPPLRQTLIFDRSNARKIDR